jgi:arylsulfatase
MKPPKVLRNLETVELEAKQETLTQRYTEHAVAFIEAAKEGPFFLYMPHTFPHIPLFASERFRGKSKQGIYGDVVEELDWSVGEVLKALKKHGLEENTLVMFSSDNGPWYQGSPGPLRGRKGMTWEGGVRVPFIARMRGAIPAGRVVDAIGSTMDVVPTVTTLAGARPPSKPTDGIDIWPMLSGKVNSAEREALLYFDGWNLQCVRWKGWKLHVARYNSVTYSPAPQGGRVNWLLDPPELYNLDTDRDESYDVAASHPEVVKEIQSRIARLLPSFPQEVQQAWAEARERGGANPAAGALPRGRKS